MPAAKSLWSNGLIERHNGIIGYTFAKNMEDCKTDLSIALSLVVSANNYLKIVNGFSLNQQKKQQRLDFYQVKMKIV